MFSPPLQASMVQSHIEELHRQASSRQRFAPTRHRTSRHVHAKPLSGYLRRASARFRAPNAHRVTTTSGQPS